MGNCIGGIRTTDHIRSHETHEAGGAHARQAEANQFHGQLAQLQREGLSQRQLNQLSTQPVLRDRHQRLARSTGTVLQLAHLHAQGLTNDRTRNVREQDTHGLRVLMQHLTDSWSALREAINGSMQHNAELERTATERFDDRYQQVITVINPGQDTPSFIATPYR
ncbi:hypothetical protein [Pseudomonas indica]|uniref:hypothetical protein n=1 Tax=Pseudomonas indica TaxID=137658 RepID=UPI0023F96D70|nr:hypothetical protein [Pseudomonas indica]MBU3055821.1 hypothetical protein [Pseudomonas indica]